MALTPAQAQKAKSSLLKIKELLDYMFAGGNGPGEITIDENSTHYESFGPNNGTTPALYENVSQTLNSLLPSAYGFSNAIENLDLDVSGSALSAALESLTAPALETVDYLQEFDSSVYENAKMWFAVVPAGLWYKVEPVSAESDTKMAVSQFANDAPDSAAAFLEGLESSLKQFLSFFGVTYFNRRRLPTPPNPIDAASMMPEDSTLEVNYPRDPAGLATHYISSLEPEASSAGAREGAYLPVRLSPGNYPTPLANGWDDENYKLLNKQGKITNQAHPRSDGLTIDVGTQVFVTEIVLGLSGVWVGFVPVGSVPGPTSFATKGNQRVLYTHPEYLRRYTGVSNPVLSQTLMPHDGQNMKPSVTKGASLIKPDSNLNWTTLEHANVHLAYYSFDDHNKKYPVFKDEQGNADTSPMNAELAIGAMKSYPRLRFSEGYYYFVTVDGTRPTVGELLENITPAPGVENSQEMQEAKEDAIVALIEELKPKAFNTILEYAGKDIPDPESPLALSLKDFYIAPAAQHVATRGGGNNAKVLFAMPAQVVDGLPDSKNLYYDNIDQELKDKFSGKDYTFTIKATDVSKISVRLVQFLNKIKTRLESFRSEGGMLKNPNGIDYNIDSQIKRIEQFPEIINQFLKRQVSSGANDTLSEHLVAGADIPGDALLQFGLRDNGEVGGGVRQTISFVLYSPDPDGLKQSNRKEFVTLDPYLIDEEKAGFVIPTRTGMVLNKSLPWLRSKFLDAEGARTLHYFMSHRNLVQFESDTGADLRLNEWIKLLQAYTVPPLLIKLSKEKTTSPEQIDCKKLVDELLSSPTVVDTKSKKLREIVENKCGKEYLEAVLADTDASDPESSEKALNFKQLLSKNADAYGNAFSDIGGNLTILYKQFLHKLDPQGLIALLMACLQEQLGIELTAEALCEVAIEKLIESIGVEEIKKVIVKEFPDLALFFPALRVAQINAGLVDIEVMQPDPYNYESSSEEFASEFNEVMQPSVNSFGNEHIVNQNIYTNAPIAAAIKLTDHPETKNIPVHKIILIAKLERMGYSIPLVPSKEVDLKGDHKLAYLTYKNSMYIEKGFSEYEARAAMVRDGDFVIYEEFLLRDIEPNPIDATIDAVSGAEDFFSDIGDSLSNTKQKLSNLPPGTDSLLGAKGSDLIGVAETTAETAAEFLNFLKRIIDLQQLCESLVGPLLQAPGLLFSDPDQFSANWENWAANLKNSLVRQFKPPDLNIPKLGLPDSLSTDDLIGDYATKLVQAICGAIGMILGEILNLLLKELLEKCFNNPQDNDATGLRPAGSELSIPLPIINDINAGLPSGPGLRPDWSGWWADIIGILSKQQLCQLLKFSASEETILIVLNRTEKNWPSVWDLGLDNSADIEMLFKQAGDEMRRRGDLDICDAIQALTPILVTACDAKYDYDARCAELQMNGLTKEECDEQIKQEIEDLKNKLKLFSSQLFPGSNDMLANVIPEPCGPNGYFVLPSMMENTMGRITDNFLRSVKRSLLDDLTTIEFFSVPPAAFKAAVDPSVLESSYDLAIKATDSKEEIISVMPINNSPFQSSVDFNKGTAGMMHLPAVYSTTGWSKFRDSAYSPASRINPTSGDDWDNAFNKEDLKDYESTFGDDSVLPYCFWNTSIPNTKTKENLASLLQVSGPANFLSCMDLLGVSLDSPNTSLGGSVTTTRQSAYQRIELFNLEEYITHINDIISQTLGEAFTFAALDQGYSEDQDQNNLAARKRFIKDNELALGYVALDLEDGNYGDCGSDSPYYGYFEPGDTWFDPDGTGGGELAFLSYTGKLKCMTEDEKNHMVRLREEYIKDKILSKIKTISNPGFPSGRWEEIKALALDFTDPGDVLKEILPKERGQKQSKAARKLVLSGDEYILARVLNQKKSKFAESEYTKRLRDATLTLFELNEPVKRVVNGELKSAEEFRDLLDEAATMASHSDPATQLMGLTIAADANLNDNPALYLLHLMASFVGCDAADIPFDVLSAPVTDILNFQLNHVPVSDPLGMKLTGEEPVVFQQEVARNTWQYRFFQWITNYSDYHIQTHYDFELSGGTHAGIKRIYSPVNVAGYNEPERFHTLSSVVDIDSSPIFKTIKEIARYSQSSSDTLFNCFLNMPIGKACGLTNDTIKKLFPEYKGMFGAIKGVYLSLENIFSPAGGGYNRELALELAFSSYNNEEIAHDFVSNIFSKPQLVVKALAMNNFFRGDNPLDELRPCDLVPGQSNQPVSTQFIKMFDDPSINPTFARGMYERGTVVSSNHSLGVTSYNQSFNDLVSINEGQIPGLTGNTRAWHMNTNYNPNVFYFPMPFKNKLSIGRANKISQGLLDSLQKTTQESKYSGMIDSSVRTANLDNILVYQETPLYPPIGFYKGQKRDSYMIAKSKVINKDKVDLMSFGDVAYNPVASIENEKQLLQEEYKFDIHEDYDDDVLQLLNEIDNKINNFTPFLNLAHLKFDNDQADWGFHDLRAAGGSSGSAQIFGKLISSKLSDLISEYAIDTNTDKEYLNTVLPWAFTHQGYSSCRMAYSNKIFGKLRLSRLNHSKFMKKMWKKILKSPLTSARSNKECKDVFDSIAKNNSDLQKTETDFFKIDKVKPEIINFYKKSVCYDVYEQSTDVYSASQRALIEGSLSLLVKVYVLEMCLAGAVAWDSYDLDDIFSQKIISRILIKNISADFEDPQEYENLLEFAKNIARKETGVVSIAARTQVSDESGLEYLIRRESRNINSIVRPMFTNSNPLNLSLSLSTVYSDDPMLFKEMSKVSLKQNVRQRRFDCEDNASIMVNQALFGYPTLLTGEEPLAEDILLKIEEESLYLNSFSEFEDVTSYPAVSYLQDNVYTHNYYDGVLQNRYFYTRGFYGSMDGLISEHENKVIYSSQRSNKPETAMDFSGFQSKVSQKNFLHSVPLNYFPQQTLSDPEDMLAMVSNELVPTSEGFVDDSKIKTNQFYDYVSKINITPVPELLRSKLMCDPSQFINQHEFMVGNGLNNRIGNFIFQPYVRLVDQDDRSFKSRKGMNLEPCDIDDKTQGSIVEAENLIPDGPILSEIREGNNPYSAWVFDVVPLSIFNWFLAEELEPWLNQPQNVDVNVLYKDHGMKIFFKEVKFGMRMVYVSSFGPLVSTSGLDFDEGSVIEGLKETFGDEGFRRSKAGLTSRIYSLENRTGQTSEDFDVPYRYKKNNATFSNIRKMPQLMHELHIPIASYEESLEITKGLVHFNGRRFNYEEFSHGSVNKAFTGAAAYFDIKEFRKPQHKNLLKTLTQTPSNFYFSHFADRALSRVQSSPEFKLIFNHLIPIKRYMALGFLYSSDVLTPHIGETTDLLDQTKSTILNVMRSLIESQGDYAFIAERSQNSLENDLNMNRTGTTAKEPSLTAQIKMIIYKTLLMILKGFVEITDPAVITAKAILDLAKAIYDAIIIAVETSFNAAKQGFQAVIDAATSAKTQIEISVAMAGPGVQLIWDPIKSALDLAQPGLSDEAVPELSVDKEKITEWVIDVNAGFVPPEDTIEQAQWDSFVDAATDLKSAISEFKKVDDELEKAKKEKEDLEVEYKLIMEGKDGKSGIKGEMEKVFGSNFLLPATWAAILPSMVPYGAGIIPPPFVVGPPSTFPGIVYLVLLMSDAYEELEAEESLNNTNDDPNCEDEL